MAWRVILLLSLVAFSGVSVRASAQDVAAYDTSGAIEALREQLERSYVFPMGGLVGNHDALLFEGNIAPPFVVTQQRRWALVFTPKVVVRMLSGGSWPVRTPSYMPRGTLYWFMSDMDSDSADFLTFTFSHHSNGQEGPFRKPDGTINDVDGNFSTNFVEVAYHFVERDTARDHALAGARLGIEMHPPPFMDDSLEGLYSPVRTSLSSNANVLGTIVGFDVQYLWGRMGPGVEALDKQRVRLWTTVGWEPRFLTGMSVFLNLYVGQDYYNMKFPRHLSTLRFGVATRRAARDAIVRAPF